MMSIMIVWVTIAIKQYQNILIIMKFLQAYVLLIPTLVTTIHSLYHHSQMKQLTRCKGSE